MKLWTALLLIPALGQLARAAVDPDHLRCLVCRQTVDEFESAIAKLDPRKTVEIGNWRLDESGSRVPLSKSQVHLSEMLDDLCKKLNDYVRVRYKATGKLAVMKMLSESGGMNPDFGKTDFITDDDLNKSLEFYCEGIIGENEDEIIDMYAKREGDSLPDGKQIFCAERMKLCEDWMLPDERDLDWNNDREKKRGGDPYGFAEMNNNPFLNKNDNEDDGDEGPVENMEDDGEPEKITVQKEEL